MLLPCHPSLKVSKVFSHRMLSQSVAFFLIYDFVVSGVPPKSIPFTTYVIGSSKKYMNGKKGSCSTTTTTTPYAIVVPGRTVYKKTQTSVSAGLKEENYPPENVAIFLLRVEQY